MQLESSANILQPCALTLYGAHLAEIDDARREHGQIRAFDNDTYDVTKAVPTVVMRNEDYGRIWRCAVVPVKAV